MTRYALSKLAAESLDAIEQYTSERWGDEQAERYIEALFVAFERLADNPMLGRRRSDIPPTLQIYGVGAHLIAYRSNELESVEIVAILHPSMDVAKRIKAALAERES